MDPLTKKYPWYTPYSFSGNKLINSTELEGLEEKIRIWNGQEFKDFDRSMIKPADWLKIKVKLYNIMSRQYENGKAEWHGREDYLKHQSDPKDPLHAQLTPETGVLYIHNPNKGQIFEYRDIKKNIPVNTDGIMMESFLIYNPIGPLIHDWFSDKELDDRDTKFQSNVSNTWTTIGVAATGGAAGNSFLAFNSGKAIYAVRAKSLW